MDAYLFYMPAVLEAAADCKTKIYSQKRSKQP
jgi:hypothetical protein